MKTFVFCLLPLLIEAHWASNLGFYRDKDYGPYLARFPRAKRNTDVLKDRSAAWQNFMICTSVAVGKMVSKDPTEPESTLEKQCRVVNVAYQSLLKCYSPEGFTGADLVEADTLFRNLRYVQSYCNSNADKFETLNKKKLEDECVKKALSQNVDKMKQAELQYSTYFQEVLEGKITVSREEKLCELAADFSKAVLPYLRACGLSSQRIEYEIGRIYLGTVSMVPVEDPIPLEKCFADHDLDFNQHFLL